MRDELIRILTEYPAASQTAQESHPLAIFIRDQGKAALEEALGQDKQNFQCIGRPGMGRWTDTPWLGVMDPLVTTTPQEGYYIAYITSSQMDRVVLSLQLGTTTLKKELGTKAAYAHLQYLAALIQARLPEYQQHFSQAAIDLQPSSTASRAASYEKGHAFGKTYRTPLPSEDVLRQDLRQMAHLYRQLTFRGGINDPEESGPETTETQSYTGAEDKRRFHYHRVIDRNKALAREAKKIHGHICQVCGFDFVAVYGPLGLEYIEAHHLTPLSQLSDSGPVQLDAAHDFAVVCANCHRMIHRKNAPATFDEFKQLFQSYQSPAVREIAI